MRNLITYYLLFTPAVFLFWSCSNDSNSSNTKSTSEEHSKVKLIAKSFCEELVNTNYKKMAEYVDNDSKNILKEWSFNKVTFFDQAQFLSVDTCVIKGTKALCVCNFKTDEFSIVDSLELNKFVDGWKVNIKWGVDKVNPFIFNTNLTMKASFPDNTPYLLDTLEKASFENAAMLITEFVHYPDNVVGYLEKNMYNEMRINNELDGRDSIFPLIKYGVYEKMEGWNATLDYDKMDISIEYFFDSDDLLKQLRFTLISEEDYKPFTYFQEYAVFFTQRYGKPYNAVHINQEEFYKYQKLKWFVKSYNEELIIENGEYSLIITLIAAD
jgi:hypothetical protein